jgi:hypothetical protein
MKPTTINILRYLQHGRTVWDDVLMNIAAFAVGLMMLYGAMGEGIRAAKHLQKTERRARVKRRFEDDIEPAGWPEMDSTMLKDRMQQLKHWQMRDSLRLNGVMN